MKKVLIFWISVALMLGGTSAAEAKSFKNCAALLKAYPTGIAKTANYKNKGLGPIMKPKVSNAIYGANRSKDIDRDGIVCERVASTAKLKEIESPYLGTFANYCDPDPSVPAEWANYSRYFNSLNICTGTFRYQEPPIVTTRPKTALSDVSLLVDVGQCKLPNNRGRMSWVGFPSTPEEKRQLQERNHPSPNTVFQIIPLTAPDAPITGGSPSEDYKAYFDFFKLFIEKSSDVGSNVQFRIPDEWIELSEPIKPFGIDHKTAPESARQSFIEKVRAVADPKIDFRGANLTLIVVPAGTPLDVLEQGHLSHFFSSEGIVQNITALTPNTIEPGKRREYSNIQHPMMTIHELYHVGTSLDDHYGDGRMDLENSGMGRWGMMNTGIMDLLGWEKWLVGFWGDKQIRCAPKDQTTTHWLAPASARGEDSKLLVVPLSETNAIVVESQRAMGFNYRLPVISEGALVYEVDLTDTRHGYGFDLLLADRKLPRHGKQFIYANAPLKVGESVSISGLRISVTEAGKFGDVVKVEPSK